MTYPLGSKRVTLHIEAPPADSSIDVLPLISASSTSATSAHRSWGKAKSIRFLALRPKVFQQLQRSPVLRGGDDAQSPAPPITPVHCNYLSKLKTGVRMGGFSGVGGALGELLMDTKVKHATEKAQLEAASGAVVTEHAEGDEEGVEYWRQGDASLNTAEALRERFALRKEASVVSVLQDFWEAALRSIQSGGETSAYMLSFEGYSLLLRRVYRVLLEEWDAADADSCIADDWKNDARGNDEMSREQFMDALFELADTCECAHRSLPAEDPNDRPRDGAAIQGSCLVTPCLALQAAEAC